MVEYVCRECSHETTGSPFRSTCPRCGGRLERPERRQAGAAGG